MKAKILDTKGIYFGEENFKNGEVVDVISLNHDGECQVLVVFSNVQQRNFRIYEGEFSSIEFLN